MISTQLWWAGRQRQENPPWSLGATSCWNKSFTCHQQGSGFSYDICLPWARRGPPLYIHHEPCGWRMASLRRNQDTVAKRWICPSSQTSKHVSAEVLLMKTVGPQTLKTRRNIMSFLIFRYPITAHREMQTTSWTYQQLTLPLSRHKWPSAVYHSLL